MTGVIINGYEIQNWHTVSILELYRARKTQERGRESARPAPVKKSEKKTRRSRDMARQMLISEEAVRELNARYLDGESLPAIVGDYSITSSTAVNYFKRLGLTYPRPKTETSAHPGHAAAAIAKDQPQLELPKETEPITLVTGSAPPAPVGDDQMDDPEAVVAAAPVEPPPAVDTTELARQRARELHQRAQVKAQGGIIAVEDLPPMFSRKHYQPPRVTAFGDLFRVSTANAMPVAQMVGKLVEELNTIPGVRADFGFSFQMTAGVRS